MFYERIKIVPSFKTFSQNVSVAYLRPLAIIHHLKKHHKIIEDLLMINVIAFQNQYGLRYTLVLFLPILILFGNLIRFLELNHRYLYLIGYLFVLVIFIIFHLFLKQRVGNDSKKYAKEIGKRYNELRKKEIFIILFFVLLSLFLAVILSVFH